MDNGSRILRFWTSRRLRTGVAGIAALALVMTMPAAAVLNTTGSGLPVGEAAGGPAAPDEEYFIVQRAGGPGKILDDAAILRGQNQARALYTAAAPEAAADPASAQHQLRGEWEHVGPNNIGGRIADLVIDVDDPGVVYVAAATGGVWKGTAHETDGGLTMEYAFDETAPQGMGAIAMGEDGRLWAGTGEPQPGGGSITFPGNGVYRSDDRGESWRHVGLRNSHNIGRIAVRPDNPDTIFVAATGSLFNPGEERGIYRSTTGGASWTLVLAPETPFTGGIDLAIDPSNPDRIYAAMWDHRRQPHVRTYAGTGSGVFRSDDGGDTWTRLDNVAELSLGDETGLASDESLGRIGIGLAASNPDRVYVVTGGQSGLKGFYVSDDGGNSFTAQTPPGSQSSFPWWFGRIWVDPLDEDHLYVAGVQLRRSTDGGATWADSDGLVGTGNIHVDQHAMQFSEAIPGRVYVGNDGGTYRSDGNGASGTWSAATFQPYMQFYTLDVGEQFPDRVVGGAQDNGSLRSWTGQNPGSPDGWASYNGGDGETTLIDPSDNNVFYGCSQYGNCVRRYDGPDDPPPVTNTNITAGTISDRRNWTTPVVFDPNDPSILYYGGNHLNRSTDHGSSWELLSEGVDLTGDFESRGEEVDPDYPNWGTLTTIAPAATDPDTIYVGTDTGRVWKTEDLGETWHEFVDLGLPERWVTRIAVDPLDEQTAYATFSGYRAGETASHVFKTTDGGETWKDISGNLPNAPVNDIVIDHHNSTVIVGGDVGIYHLKNGKRNWKPAGTGLPLAPVLDIRLHEPTNALYTSTFGLGMYKLDLSR
jgi:photosystem II stability/assembly factor-like uncharacterized protein